MDEYSWASAVGRIRVSEREFLPHARLQQMAESDGLEAALASLRDTNYGPYVQALGNPQEFGDAIEKALRGAYGYIMSISPEPALIAAYRARHDFHNLKALLKSVLLGIRGEDQALSTMGVIPTETLRKAATEGVLQGDGLDDLTVLVGRGLIDAYAGAARIVQDERRSSRPDMLALEVDCLIDQAYYSWASRLVLRAGHEGLAEFLGSEVDVLNLKISVRAARLGISAGLAGRLILTGGSVEPDRLLEAYGAGLPAIVKVYKDSPWSSLAEDGAARCQKNESLTRWEKTCDDALMAVVKKARYFALGPEPAYGFIFGKEAEARNLRVILSGKQSLLPSREIAERLRDPYV